LFLGIKSGAMVVRWVGLGWVVMRCVVMRILDYHVQGK